MIGSKTFSVLLIDDHSIWRGGVCSILRGTQFEVVGEASNTAEALLAVRELRPQIALLDVRMRGEDGLDALPLLKKAHPSMAIIMLTTYDHPIQVARAIAKGASGYLLKGTSRTDLLSALEAVSQGEILFQETDMARLNHHKISEDRPGAGLTKRELSVLQLIATGLSNREIGAALFVAESTVKTHVDNLIAKLQVADRVQAAVWAAHNGFAPRLEP